MKPAKKNHFFSPVSYTYIYINYFRILRFAQDDMMSLNDTCHSEGTEGD